MPIINVHNLEKSFAGKTLFKGINFGLEEKDRIGLVGPNGAGKSTLLKILAGEMKADAGQVTARRGLRIGYLEQDPHFVEGHSIIDAILSKADDPMDAMALGYEWLAKLELHQFGDQFPVAELSGGWKKRVALARELARQPELLLMDEPTNHLDISSILWLEEYLASAQLTFLMITHDRLFLQRTVNRVIDLDPKNPGYLLSVNGDYLQYVESKQQVILAQQKREQVLKNTLRRETEWLRRGAIARQTKQKARIENTLALGDEVQDLTKKNKDRSIGIDFGENARAPKKLIDAKNLKKFYGEKTLFERLDLLVSPKTRLALLGDNGCGKSTLIKVLMGTVQPDAGSVQLADDIKITYFEQSRDALDPQKSVLKNICPDGDYVLFRGQHVFARSYLDRFLFFTQQADLPVSRLSGGEKARLRIAQMMLEDGQVLILDEPTNDLDVDTLAVLEDALKEFNGAVILVTHDRYFMDAVCDSILAFHKEESGANSLHRFSGYLQYESWFDQQKIAEKEKIIAARKQSIPAKVKLTFKEKFELENIEAGIQTEEGKMETLQKEIHDPAVISNPKRLVELTQNIAKTQQTLDQMYARWALLEKKASGSL